MVAAERGTEFGLTVAGAVARVETFFGVVPALHQHGVKRAMTSFGLFLRIIATIVNLIHDLHRV